MASSNHLLPTGAVVVTKIDEIEFGIGEIHSFIGYIQGQAIGPIYFGVDNYWSITAVHSSPLDPRIFTPIGPEEPVGAASDNINHYYLLKSAVDSL